MAEVSDDQLRYKIALVMDGVANAHNRRLPDPKNVTTLTDQEKALYAEAYDDFLEKVGTMVIDARGVASLTITNRKARIDLGRRILKEFTDHGYEIIWWGKREGA